MKNLNKKVLLFLVFTTPFILFAQPSEYVKDDKTKTVVPTQQRKMEMPVVKADIPKVQPSVEVFTKTVVEPVMAPTVYQPIISPSAQPSGEVSTKSVVEPMEEILAVMRFEKKTFHFGKVTMGEHPSHIFSYTNTGQEPVVIEIVSACDCTEVEYTKNPIAVGGTGIIKATYMSERAPENVNKEFEKEITIVLKNKYPDTGYPMVETLKIKGNVVE